MKTQISSAAPLGNTALLSGAAVLATILIGAVAFGQDTKTSRPSAATSPQASPSVPVFTANGRLEPPAQYREWVYLTTGFNMSYNPAMRMGHDMFDNVFVNPEAYRAFLETGTWPDKTVLVLELRGTGSDSSLNKVGSYQSTERMGLEVHVKDTARFDGKWGFFGFSDNQPAAMIPKSANCYSCHDEHAAVDTTFVQFYPTLLPIAQQKGTLASAYLEESKQKK